MPYKSVQRKSLHEGGGGGGAGEVELYLSIRVYVCVYVEAEHCRPERRATSSTAPLLRAPRMCLMQGKKPGFLVHLQPLILISLLESTFPSTVPVQLTCRAVLKAAPELVLLNISSMCCCCRVCTLWTEQQVSFDTYSLDT